MVSNGVMRGHSGASREKISADQQSRKKRRFPDIPSCVVFVDCLDSASPAGLEGFAGSGSGSCGLGLRFPGGRVGGCAASGWRAVFLCLFGLLFDIFG